MTPWCPHYLLRKVGRESSLTFQALVRFSMNRASKRPGEFSSEQFQATL